MPDIRIIQLNPAPEGLWRFYALSSNVDGEAVVYLSRVLSVALVQDMDHLGGVIGQRVVPITTAALTDPGELHDCLSLKQSWQHVRQSPETVETRDWSFWILSRCRSCPGFRSLR
jgi:hypothetical protein